jgi:hypothetical protein
VALAATWDEELVTRLTGLLAAEARRKRGEETVALVRVRARAFQHWSVRDHAWRNRTGRLPRGRRPLGG